MRLPPGPFRSLAAPGLRSPSDSDLVLHERGDAGATIRRKVGAMLSEAA